MKTCPEIEQALSLLLAEELDADAAKEVEIHLASCQPCAQLRARLERADALLRTAPIPRLSRDELALMALRARATGIRRNRLWAAAALLTALLVPTAAYFTFTPCQSGPPGLDAVASTFELDF